MTQIGDRMRIRVYFFANSASPIIGTCKVGPAGSEVTTCDITHSGAAAPTLIECWLHYIDNTHCNIIEQEQGSLGTISAVNVAGFTWNVSQDIIITQNQVSGNFITVFGIFVDLLAKAV